MKVKPATPRTPAPVAPKPVATTPAKPAEPILPRTEGESIWDWTKREAEHLVEHPEVVEQRYPQVEGTPDGFLIGADHVNGMLGGVQADPVNGWMAPRDGEVEKVTTRLQDKAIKDPMPQGKPNTIAVLGGPQASGKTTGAEAILANNRAGYVFDGVNLDLTEVDRVIVKIQRVEGAVPRQFEITRVLSREWISPRKPFDEKF